MRNIKHLAKQYQDEIILTLIWIISILIVNPLGEFPLNDDWAYSLDVFHLSQEGKFIFNEWPAMTLISQILWGALVTYVFGFSFTILRISTLFIGLLSVLVFYRILTGAGIHKRNSLVGALMFMFTPLFFNGAFTFMTEVYFLFSLNMSVFYFLKFFRKEQIIHLMLGTLFVLITTMIRQPGIAIGIAFAVIFLINKKLKVKQIIIAIVPATIALISYIGYSLWLRSHFYMPNYREMDTLVQQLKNTPVSFYFNRFGTIAIYLGFFSLPISVWLLPEIIKKYRWFEKIIIVLLIAISFYFGLSKNFPSGNVIYNLGLGPKLLKDTYWGYNIHPMLPEWVMNIVRTFSLLSATIVVTHFCKQSLKKISSIRRDQCSPSRLVRALFITIFLFYLGFALINPGFFDRYTLPLVPATFLVLLPVYPIHTKMNKLILGIFVSIYAFFSIATTHDYLSWNRARWDAIDFLTNKNDIDRFKIDGGFEFNAWFQTSSCNPVDKNGISWWFVGADDYVISAGDIKGFYRIGKKEYTRFLPLGKDSICILSRKDKIYAPSFPHKCNCENRNENNRIFLSETDDADFWGGSQQSSEEAYSGCFSIKLDTKDPYGLLSKYRHVHAGDHFTVTVWRKSADDKAGIVVATEPGNKYYNFNHTATETNNKGWSRLTTEIIVPGECDGLTLGIFVWNPGEKPAWFDELEISKNENNEQYSPAKTIK